jgi:aerobic carbon-monoxide dehydrogenase medium subunit
VKPAPFEYERPATLEEAVELRAAHGADSAILAGGQSLVPLLNFRMARPRLVIDLSGISSLAYVERRDGGVAIGAMSRQRDLELDTPAYEANPLLRETLQLVAHPVIRNRGTVCGSIAHADSAAELPTLFATLDARATVVGPGGEREVAGSDLFRFHMTTSLEPDELVREVWFPALEPGTGYAYVESVRRHGDYALAGVCCVLKPGGEARLGFSGVASRPAVRVDATAAEAAAVAADVVEAGDDYVASQAFRRHLVENLMADALARAAERQGAS